MNPRNPIIAALLIYGTASGDVLTKGASFVAAEKAMKSEGYRGGRMEMNSGMGELEMWMVNGGHLTINYTKSPDSVLGMSYTFILPGPKGESPIDFSVISFDTRSGQMLIEIPRRQLMPKQVKGTITNGGSIDVANRAMKEAGYGNGFLAPRSNESQFMIWSVDEGLLIANYKKGTQIIGMSFFFVVPGPERNEPALFNVISFDTSSGRMLIQTKKPQPEPIKRAPSEK